MSGEIVPALKLPWVKVPGTLHWSWVSRDVAEVDMTEDELGKIYVSETKGLTPPLLMLNCSRQELFTLNFLHSNVLNTWLPRG